MIGQKRIMAPNPANIQNLHDRDKSEPNVIQKLASEKAQRIREAAQKNQNNAIEAKKATNKKRSEDKQIIKLRAIAQHDWGDTDNIKYNAAKCYLKYGEMPTYHEEKIKIECQRISKENYQKYFDTKKKRFTFRQFLKLYQIDQEDNIYITNLDIDQNLKKVVYVGNKHDIEYNQDKKELVYDTKVNLKKYFICPPSEKENVIRNIISGENIEQTSLSPSYIYKRILNIKSIVNISIGDIKNILEKNPILKKSKVPQTKPIIKSYRPQYPRQHWQLDTSYMTFGDKIQQTAQEGLKAPPQGSMSRQNDMYSYFLVAIDIFSKFTYIFPLKKQSSEDVANCLESIFLTGDIPQLIQSDNGSEFFRHVPNLLKKYGIKFITIPSYSPQTNGFAENRNKLIKSMIYSYIVNRKRNEIPKPLRWIDGIKKIQYAINSIEHSVTKMTPLQVHFGINHVPLVDKELLVSSRLKYYPDVDNNKKLNPGITFDYNKDRQYLKKGYNGKFQQEKFDVNDINVDDQNKFSKQRSTKDIKRNKEVKSMINETATKKEKVQKNKLLNVKARLTPGSFVKVYSLMPGADGSTIFIDLRFMSKHTSKVEILEPPLGIKARELQELNKLKKWKEKVYNDYIFIIGEIRINPSKNRTYILYKYDPETGQSYQDMQLHRKMSSKDNVYTEVFFAEHLIPMNSIEVHGMKNKVDNKEYTLNDLKQYNNNNNNENVNKNNNDNINKKIKQILSRKTFQKQMLESISIEAIIEKLTIKHKSYKKKQFSSYTGVIHKLVIDDIYHVIFDDRDHILLNILFENYNKQVSKSNFINSHPQKNKINEYINKYETLKDKVKYITAGWNIINESEFLNKF